MPITAASAEELYVGAGDVFYDKANDGVFVPVGATQENNVFRLTRTYFVPDLNGALSPLKGTDYISDEIAELEVSIPEISADTLALSVPGSSSTTRTSAVVAGSTTTLAAATTAGQYLGIKLTAVVGLVVGDWIRIGPVGNREFRKLTRVGTAGAGGTGVDVDFPLTNAHANAEAVEEVDGNGATVITGGSQRRIASGQYHDWVLIAPGLDGRQVRFWVKKAIMTASPEFTAGDDSTMAPRLTLQSRRDPAAAGTAAWDIEKLPAIS